MPIRDPKLWSVRKRFRFRPVRRNCVEVGKDFRVSKKKWNGSSDRCVRGRRTYRKIPKLHQSGERLKKNLCSFKNREIVNCKFAVFVNSNESFDSAHFRLDLANESSGSGAFYDLSSCMPEPWSPQHLIIAMIDKQTAVVAHSTAEWKWNSQKRKQIRSAMTGRVRIFN